MNRHIEIMVRSQYNVPQDVDVTIGGRKPSQIPGYDTLSITLSHGARQQAIDFLISTDGKTLARLEKFDLVNDPVFSIDVAGRPIRGNPDAKVTVINFDDLECPYCARLHQELFPATLEHYKDKVRFIYKDNPLPPDMHPWAMHAAVDANCLAAQNGDAYWDFADYVHAHEDEVKSEKSSAARLAALDRLALDQGQKHNLDEPKLEACVKAQDETAVKASMKEGDDVGVSATPTLFVNGQKVDGVIPVAELRAMLDRALRDAGQPVPAHAAAAPAPAGK